MATIRCLTKFNKLNMSDLLTAIVILGIWLFLQLYLFPKFGVST